MISVKIIEVFGFLKNWIWNNKEPIKDALWEFLNAIIEVARNNQKAK